VVSGKTRDLSLIKIGQQDIGRRARGGSQRAVALTRIAAAVMIVFGWR